MEPVTDTDCTGQSLVYHLDEALRPVTGNVLYLRVLFQICLQVLFTPPRKECDGLMSDLIHYHSPINVPFFLRIVIKTDTDRGRSLFMTDIGTSQARGLAADDVLFIQQITGDTGSGLQGYAPDAFLHFPGISCVRRGQRREGVAEDFSLTRGISAAELTHIDYRMTRYFKPLQGT